MNCINTDWFFIVNPHAGSGKTMGEWVPAEQRLDKLGISYKTAYTDHKRHATSLAYEAASNGYRKILAVGGDGSLHETFNGIMKWCDDSGCDPREFTMAVAPIGSGNDWIKTAEIPHDVLKVAEMLDDKSCLAEMDVVRVETADGKVFYMANIGGTGFDSHVCQSVNLQKEGGKRGKRIYLNALLNTIMKLSPIKIQVLADEVEKFNGEAFSVALGNGRYSGSGMRQVPDADFNDGILDAMIVPKQPVLPMATEIPNLFTGKINKSGKCISIKCKELQIIPLDADSADIFELDGEIEGRLPVRITMDGRQIGILSGKKAQESTEA